MSRSKVTQTNNIEKEVLITQQTEVVEMTLNTESAVTSGLLIQRLTELYEDPIVATVRETMSNALDAVTESHDGDRPEVWVSTPTSLNPILTIRDNGVGMSYDDLKNVYAKYGASSKINDMNQIGAYGLGAKAPLSYGNEFTVASVKDGVKTIIIVAKEEITNYIKIVDSSETDEPSGTKVIIPVNSGDISEFNDHVNKYYHNPVDKDVDLYIDSKLVVPDKYLMITDELITYRGSNGEVVEARMWINGKDTHELLSHYGTETLQASLKFLIGGWVYDSPATRKNRYSRGINAGIIIELKSGIVGFNSARDAILENERYDELESLVIDYIRSEDFMKVIVKSINQTPIKQFKNIVSTLIHEKSSLVRIENGKGRFDEGTSSGYYGRPHSKEMHPVTFEMLTHEETGFNLNDLFKNIPKGKSITTVIREEKNRYNKSVSNSIMRDNETKRNLFSTTRISDINYSVEKIFNKIEPGHSMEDLLLNMAELAYANDVSDEQRFSIITNVKTEDNVKDLKNARKTLVRIANEGKQDHLYQTYLVYTSMTKAQINKMIKGLGLETLSLTINTVDEIIKKTKEFRKSNKKPKKAVQAELSTTIYKLMADGADYSRHSDMDEEENNLIIVSDTSINSEYLKMTRNWYCNENKIDPEDVEVYSSIGMHKASDIKILQEMGEVLRYQDSDEAGRSQLYMDEIHDKVAGMSGLLDTEKDIEIKAMTRLLTGFTQESPSESVDILIETFSKAREYAEAAGLEIPKKEGVFLDLIKNTDSDSFPKGGYYRAWTIKHGLVNKDLLSKLNDEQKDLIQDLSVLMRQSRIHDSESRYSSYSQNSRTGLDMYSSSIKEIFSEDNELPKAYTALKKAQVEAYVIYINDIITRMSTVKFS